jgi:hypothetical protein
LRAGRRLGALPVIVGIQREAQQDERFPLKACHELLPRFDVVLAAGFVRVQKSRRTTLPR